MKIKKYLTEGAKLAAVPVAMKTGRTFFPPSVAALHLTRRCNSRCSMCSFWKKDFDASEELSTEQVFRVLEDLKGLGSPFLSLGGEGEIFTRKDACDIFKKARELDLDYTINSNGLYLPEKFVENLGVLRPNGIIFGLDTVDDATYEKVRGVPGGLSKVKQSISRLTGAGFKNISIGSVILPENLAELVPLSDTAKSLGLSAIRFTAFSPVGFGMTWEKKELEIYQDPAFLSRLKSVIETLIEKKQEHGIISNSVAYLRRVPDYYASGFFYKPATCVVGVYNLLMLPNGDVPVCGFRGPGAVVGNVKTQSVADIWQSPAYQEQRNRIARWECPTCWLSCYAENNLRFYPKTMAASNLAALRRALSLGA